ncbi:potassium voltage-gated channel protein egl-36-like isoform X2 [Mytilus edulis]|uniref:potassium voltage-gated channel protein egl-36-like isoform X2 n=1 Tax=Mytilus edulis TaxID=6550 RepID=UPI0039F12080
MDGKTIKLNVSGTCFELSQTSMTKLLEIKSEATETLLKLKKDNNTEVFFERHPGIFPSILGYLQGREMHFPSSVCVGEFLEELKFWGIDTKYISKCCLSKVVTFTDEQKTLQIMEKDQNVKDEKRTKLLKKVEGKQSWEGIQARGWLVLEEPSTSVLAKVYFFTSALFVLASIFGLVCQTHPSFRRKLIQSEWEEYFGDDFDAYKGHFDGSSTANTTIPPLPEMVSTKLDFLYYIEFITVAYFTVEIITRFVLFPYKYTSFFCDFLNLVDIFSLVVMFSIYFANLANPKDKYEKSIFDIIHCLQIVRIFRLFRLVKNFTGFRVLMYAVRASGFEVLLMSMFLVVAMLMFGAFAFFSGDTAFPSIPDSFWWAVVTMTTVGYGDMVPTIGLSKCIGSLCAITGVCLLAVIIPIFVNNFVMFYNYSKVWRTASENDYANVSKARPNSCHKIVPHTKVTPQSI